jgi:hypothetical protein
MPLHSKKYIVDIDGTICETVDGDYDNSRPLNDRIDKINALYDEGHIGHILDGSRGGVREELAGS